MTTKLHARPPKHKDDEMGDLHLCLRILQLGVVPVLFYAPAS